MPDWQELIFSDRTAFKDKAGQIFHYQYENNPVYRRFCEALAYPTDRSDGSAGSFPLLPANAFKDAVVTCMPDKRPDLVFRSSGTSTAERSLHLVADAEIYRRSLLDGFRQFYKLDEVALWAYTPGYSDNPDSSLVWMLNELIEQDRSGLSRYLPLGEPLREEEVSEVRASGRNLVIFGAAFGLLDLQESSSVALPGSGVVIETGGMKTHRREITKTELHRRLATGFGLDRSRIHSEYGMCELLSQSYATGGSWFRPVPWMQVTIRNPENPMEELPPFEEGVIGVIDLANVHSCSFVLTGDRGDMDREGRFRVLGRWNPRDLRGCNFLIEED